MSDAGYDDTTQKPHDNVRFIAPLNSDAFDRQIALRFETGERQLSYLHESSTNRLNAHKALESAVQGKLIDIEPLVEKQKHSAFETRHVAKANHENGVTGIMLEHQLSQWVTYAKKHYGYQMQDGGALNLINCYFSPNSIRNLTVSANASFSIFENQQWQNVALDGSTLYRARFYGNAKDSHFTDCSFKNCNLRRSGWDRLHIKNVSFDGADLTATVFNQVTIERATFKDAKLNRAKFNNVTFKQCDFTELSNEQIIHLMKGKSGVTFYDCKLPPMARLMAIAEGELSGQPTAQIEAPAQPLALEHQQRANTKEKIKEAKKHGGADIISIDAFRSH